MACPELTAFRIAVESLEDGVLKSPEFARMNYFRNMMPVAEFVKNQGTTRSNFTIKPSMPTDDQTLWTNVTISATNAGITTPGCDPTYEDIGVDFFERTYGPKERNFRGPVICREHFEYQHSIDDFIEGYIFQIRQWIAATWEFGLRGDHIRLGDWFIDGVKYIGPNAATTAPRAYQGLTQDILDLVAVDRIGIGVTQGTVNGDYVINGNAGPIYPLYVDMVASQQILKANPHMRDDARFASEGAQGSGDFGLWRALGSNRTIGNFRHVSTNIAPRFNFNSGYQIVSPFKDITAVGTDQVIITDAYKNAAFEAAIMGVPSAYTVEAVRPQSAGLAFDMTNYNGDLDFITGGERICNPAIYDPRHEKGRHFAKIIYAAAPKYPHNTAIVVYKRCPVVADYVFCS